jgi:hypothetical protein
MIRRWADRWGWIERARAYDQHMDRLKREAAEKEIVEMHARYAAAGASIWQKVAGRLAKLNPEDLSPRDIARLVESAYRIESRARGLPTEVVEQRIKDEQDGSPLWDVLKQEDIRKLLAGLVRRPAPAANSRAEHDPSTNGHVAESNGAIPHP